LLFENVIVMQLSIVLTVKDGANQHRFVSIGA